MKSICNNKLAKLISECGQIAEHKSEKMQQHNINEDELMNGLTKEEQDTLENLLIKLKKQWFEDHKKRMMDKKAKEALN